MYKKYSFDQLGKVSFFRFLDDVDCSFATQLGHFSELYFVTSVGEVCKYT